MNLLGLLFLIITQFITGLALVSFFKVDEKTIIRIALANLCGVAVFSFLPFLMELVHIPITLTNVGIFIGLITAMALVQVLRSGELKRMTWTIKLPQIYEVPFLIIICLLAFVSVWRCFYYAPNARDMLSGPEAIAEFAIREFKIINSVFSLDLATTNNQLKPPYIISLQIIYKLFVQPFGQLWLSVIFINYTIIILTLLREKLHPIIYYTILLYYFAMPEVFGYTYLMLFDYSNMVFLFAGYFFVNKFLTTRDNRSLYFAVVLFAFANYIRVETVLIMALMVPRVMYMLLKDKVKPITIAWKSALLMSGAVLVYFLVMNIYVKHYIPGTYNVGSDVNPKLGDISPLFTRLSDMVTVLVFGQYGFFYFGYFINIFLVIAAVDLVFFRKYTSDQVNYLWGIFAVFFGLAVIGYVLPLADLEHTTKRGMFKLFPLMLLYIANSKCLQKLTEVIRNWEYPQPAASKYSVKQPAPAVAQPAQQQVKPKPKDKKRGG